MTSEQGKSKATPGRVGGMMGYSRDKGGVSQGRTAGSEGQGGVLSYEAGHEIRAQPSPHDSRSQCEHSPHDYMGRG